MAVAPAEAAVLGSTGVRAMLLYVVCDFADV